MTSKECPICLNPLKDGVVLTTSCKHEFHEICLREWKNANANARFIFTCPMCRSLLQLQDLFDVIGTGSYEDVKLLLEKGMDISQTNYHGDTALMWAALGGNLEIVKLLLEKGADVSHKNTYGDTALIWVARSGHLEIVKLLLENGADVSHQNIYGNTALIKAAREGHLEIVKLLLENGADTSHANNNGDTALISAARSGRLENIITILAYSFKRLCSLTLEFAQCL